MIDDVSFFWANRAAWPVVGLVGLALGLLVWARPSLARRAVMAGALLLGLVVAVTLTLQAQQGGAIVLRVGGWLVPYGITLVVDTLAGIMLSLASLTGLATVVYGFAATPVAQEHPLRLPLMAFLLAGIQLAFITGDLFNLFVAFEVMLLSSYALLTLEVGARESRQAWSYLVLNLLGSALFLATCGFTYGLLGTLQFSEMIVRLDALGSDPRVELLAISLLFVFGLKAGIFPLYSWLPGSYPILPAPVAAFYAGMLTKVGVYVVMRLCGTLFPPTLASVHGVLAWMAGITLVIGVLGAVAQTRVKTILSYHIVSQIGFMLLAVGLFTPFAFAAAIFYIMHHILVKASLFLVGGVVERAQPSDGLATGGGLWKAAPGLGVVFVIQAMSLAGLPPLSGFWGKFMIVQEGFSEGEWILVTLSLVGSILTLLSMLKIWLSSFWQEAPAGHAPVIRGPERRMTAVIAAVTALSLGIGFHPQPWLKLAEHAAAETLDRQGYVARVQEANRATVPGKHPAGETVALGSAAAGEVSR